MMISYHRLFEKKFKKLPRKVRYAFYERLDLFRSNKFNPLLNNHALGAEYLGQRSINVTGNHRAIFEENGVDILFVNIGTHSELYGK